MAAAEYYGVPMRSNYRQPYPDSELVEKVKLCRYVIRQFAETHYNTFVVLPYGFRIGPLQITYSIQRFIAKHVIEFIQSALAEALGTHFLLPASIYIHGWTHF
jgi:hypothetical protein